MRNQGQFILYFLLALLSACTNFSEAGNGTQAPNLARLILVDPSGKGNFTKIQDAIDAVPSNNSELVFIRVEPGTYREKLVVPADKPFITLSGKKASSTIVTGDDSGDIFGSPTVSVLASDFVGRYLTIQNTFGLGAKAVALRVSGDRVVFSACRITSHQDTLLDDVGRHYYRNCYIEGDVDFIFGNAASLFQKCHINSVSRGGGFITAQHRASPLENTGFVFLGCTITGLTNTFLGRPWGPYSRVIFALSYMSSAVLPQGWDDWGDSTKQRTAYYGQYECYGPGADTSKRVPWSRVLTGEEVSPLLTTDMVNQQSWFRNAPTIFN
ncbi:hypothetical protein EUGRSUZ_F01580 [Eucalyptus grandis]|uniref:Pectinesterase n=2 Tax=Eucalyptus grandis TaxID=71139 RepID=A0A059BP89_EUCGR|nr:hypothetical protein EUGRSUZ_F01580 [Eucalyptus grandis]